MKKLFIAGLLSISLLTGCMHTAANYASSYNNIDQLQAVKKPGRSIQLGKFTATTPGQSSIMCRLNSIEKLPSNMTYEQYIENAMRSELSKAGMLSDKSNTVLNGNIDKIDFNSMDGAWFIQMTFNSNKSRPFTVSSNYSFSSNPVLPDLACIEVAEAFTPAVRKFLEKVYNDPNFKKLIAQR